MHGLENIKTITSLEEKKGNIATILHKADEWRRVSYHPSDVICRGSAKRLGLGGGGRGTAGVLPGFSDAEPRQGSKPNHPKNLVSPRISATLFLEY